MASVAGSEGSSIGICAKNRAALIKQFIKQPVFYSPLIADISVRSFYIAAQQAVSPIFLHSGGYTSLFLITKKGAVAPQILVLSEGVFPKIISVSRKVGEEFFGEEIAYKSSSVTLLNITVDIFLKISPAGSHRITVE